MCTCGKGEDAAQCNCKQSVFHENSKSANRERKHVSQMYKFSAISRKREWCTGRAAAHGWLLSPVAHSPACIAVCRRSPATAKRNCSTDTAFATYTPRAAVEHLCALGGQLCVLCGSSFGLLEKPHGCCVVFYALRAKRRKKCNPSLVVRRERMYIG